jgi:hypothetical protein
MPNSTFSGSFVALGPTLNIRWDMYTVPDELNVYDNTGALIYTSGFQVLSFFGSFTWRT